MTSVARKWVSEWLEGLGSITLLAKETFGSLLTFKITWRDLLSGLFYWREVPVRGVNHGRIYGMVLGAQTYFQFHKVRMDTATLAVVSVSMCSELGPVLTGLMVAGRVGAAIAAELGTMKVTEQIDALRTLATHPIDYLVIPRLLALHIALPLLTIESISIGIGAGYVVGVFLLGIDPVYSWHNMVQYTDAIDVTVGLTKALIFGGIVALVGCYKGMSCGQGAEGVGRATTEAVVYSSIAILITNFFLTLTLYQIFELL
jgi:phospholipid/cholesterol/gamma-HCH transport system permease protein